jgi:hypothetical protein
MEDRNMYKRNGRTVIAAILLPLLILAIFTGCRKQEAPAEIAMKDYNEVIESESFDELTLTIYYTDPNFYSRAPVSVEQFTAMSFVTKVVISGSELEQHIDLLKRLSTAELNFVERSYINTRLYYVFESEKNGKILDVAVCAYGGGMFINGLGANTNKVFVELVLPFLPEEAQNYIKEYYDV